MTRDPYRYFRIEAREILDGLSRGIFDLGSLPAASSDREAERLLRACHTLKGAADVVGHEAIGALAHRLEGLVASHLQRAGGAERVPSSALFEVVDAIALELEELAPEQIEAPRPARAPVVEVDDAASIRLDPLELDGVLGTLSELAGRLAGAQTRIESALAQLEIAARQIGEALTLEGRDRAPTPELSLAIGAAERLHHDLRSTRAKQVEALEGAERRARKALEDVRRLRLLPAATLVTELGRAARAAAARGGTRVELAAEGGELRFDAHVLRELRAALLQLVRNAVAHAFEPAAERRAAGKPEVGRITVHFALRGARAVVTCSDDGRGIDEDAIRAALVAGGLVSETEASGMDVDGLVRAAMRIGVSTREAATELAGRGVGLQVVGSVLARLRGSILTRSARGRGTEFELEVPVAMTGAAALVVQATDVTATIPLDAVVRTSHVAVTDVTYAPEGDAIADDGKIVRFAALSRILGISGAEVDGGRRDGWIAVVLESTSGARVAVGVDRVSGIEGEIVTPLPHLTMTDALVVGASLDDLGDPRIALNPRLLVERVIRLPGAALCPTSAVKKTILVVDDSLTSRMLERSILEAAGYDVTTAASAEEALDLAREHAFALFVVDVEMPGMSGFDFVARTREDASLAATPTVLVTSRAATEDRRRGLEVGARGYIVKGEFAQDEFLDTVRRFVV